MILVVGRISAHSGQLSGQLTRPEGARAGIPDGKRRDIGYVRSALKSCVRKLGAG